MGKQMGLFDVEVAATAWIERLWASLDEEKKRRVVAALAEMAKTTLNLQREAVTEGGDNESR